jgi:hypothetical protein
MTIKQIIGPSLPRGPFSCVKGQKTVQGVWVILKQVYEGKTRALAADLMRRFQNMRCSKNDNLRTHFEHLGGLKEQLASMGKVISNEDYADIIVASLPSSYDSDIASISNSTKLSSKPLTADLLQDLILDEYMRCELKKLPTASTKDEAFAAKAPKPKKQCSNCNKCGHVKADCWAKGGSKEGQGLKRNSNKGKETAAITEEKELEAWAMIVGEEDIAKEDYIKVIIAAGSSLAQLERVHGTTIELYNSGASRHVFPSHNHFMTYQSIPPIPIRGANGSVFYAVGTGNLRIEVPDGESSTPIIL